ncbi:MAG TPA: hypothetical protein PKK61_00550 [Defluviitaleaceae bacterium]|jgi:uncharacterized protein (DUF2267 family)|nr:hypothetical protein [Candidatus Epulonipiscium sp.]HOA79541.1 hypothetical protein [Defluviitaleaceae bacterium]
MKKDLLKDLDPDMIKEANDVMNSLKGKSDEEILENLVKLAAQRKQSGKKLTKEQNEAILEAMKETLPPEQRKKFKAVLQMMKILNI